MIREQGIQAAIVRINEVKGACPSGRVQFVPNLDGVRCPKLYERSTHIKRVGGEISTSGENDLSRGFLRTEQAY
jgi:hypothetical protein